jgi:hypothetical protein
MPTAALRPGAHTFVVDVISADGQTVARSAPMAFIVD